MLDELAHYFYETYRGDRPGDPPWAKLTEAARAPWRMMAAEVGRRLAGKRCVEVAAGEAGGLVIRGEAGLEIALDADQTRALRSGTTAVQMRAIDGGAVLTLDSGVDVVVGRQIFDQLRAQA